MSGPPVGRERRARFGPADVLAGLSVALVLIPQSLAYAELAGLPAYHGLYAAALPPLVAAAFASSPYLQTGPVAMTSLLTFGALSTLAPVASPQYVALAALLALVVGVARVGLGMIRLGWVAYLMSQPILTGFTTGAAILIIASQLPTVLGVDAPSGRLLVRAWWAVSHMGVWEPPAIALAVLTGGLVFGGRKLHALFPGVLVALAVGLAFSIITGYGGSVVGEVPSGFPTLSLALPWGELPRLLVPGVVIALVGFAEPAAIARHFATQDRRPWSPDREFVSQGAANLAAGLSGGFPVGGSFSRTSINRLAGGRTRWSGAVTGAAVLAFLAIASVLAPLPRTILGAIVIVAVIKLVQFGPLVRLNRVSRPQALVAWTTFTATLTLAPRIERAVLVGVALAVFIHLWRELRLHVSTRFEGTTLRLAPKGVLFFASAPNLDEALLRELGIHPDTERVVVDLSGLGRIDYTGAIALKEMADDLRDAGIKIELSGVPPQARRVLLRVLGPDWPLLRRRWKTADMRAGAAEDGEGTQSSPSPPDS